MKKKPQMANDSQHGPEPNLPGGIECLGGFVWENPLGDAPELGHCCACNEKSSTIVIQINRIAPEPEHGWGCVVCDRQGGANVTLCKECLAARAPIRFACAGYPKDGRVLLETLTEPFGHDMAKHPECFAPLN